jgi:hypothetical protein
MTAILWLVVSLCGATVASADAPPAYVWQLTCADDVQMTFGPYGSAEACRAERGDIAAVCGRPLLALNVPDPAFLRIADVCARAHNGWDCVCAFGAVPARPVTVGDIFRAVDAAQAAGRPFRSLWDLWTVFNAPRSTPYGPIKIGP